MINRYPGPWLTPAVVMRNNSPKELPGMIRVQSLISQAKNHYTIEHSKTLLRFDGKNHGTLNAESVARAGFGC
jgi:hypothetical protein